ncbi:C40 family peptidase [Paenibacillus sp. Soil787]|uniref:C40 family peptidase n=1 Tax=Paenibacillus sp. Soil787 TaxID=1736411 RepID=UPI000702AC5C|nr:C40 family peptidase [Paenibacillus sp. Soil787]KRF29369.1 hydrolase Nlp/P60 [Paenibacillus sp. Soil787]
MQTLKTNRLSKSLVGISLSLSLLTSGTMFLSPQSAHAATDAAATTTYSATATSASKADSIVRTAQSYIGKVRYVFGVRDTNRLILDCSAYTQMVFKKNGITLPWGSSAQAKLGTPVKNKSQLRKGDLVFFSVSKPGRINHVGIYVGNGKFISNTASSGVVIRDMNTGYWKNRFIKGSHL